MINKTKAIDTVQMANKAMEFFGMILHPDKTKVMYEVGELEFLGYKISGARFIIDDKKLFESYLYTSNRVVSVTHSFSRLLSYMLLGGIHSSRFCSYFNYFRQIATIDEDELTLQNEDLRKWKYVLKMKPPDLCREIDKLHAQWLFTFGDEPFVADCL